MGHEHVWGGITGSSHPDWLTLWMEVWGPVGGGVLVCRASCWCSAGGLACRSAEGWWGSHVGPISLLLPEGGMGVLRGKSLGISPRSAQVAMLRYSLLAISEKYTICLVSRPVGWALILSKAAPMIGRLVPLAECITRFTGIRSAADRRRPDRRLGPARQLWQPVSAMAVVARSWVSVRRVWPWYLKSSARAEIETSMFGCGGDLFWLQRWDCGSQVWWWRAPSVMVSICSNTALSCSMDCQHIRAVWFCLPHDEQVVPKAGQCIRRWAVRSCSPCPWRPQKLQMPRLMGVVLGDWLGWLWPRVGVFLWLGWLLPLVVVWLGGRVGVALPGPCPVRGAGRFCWRR